MNPTTSIIIVTYNSADYISRCLKAISTQHYRPVEVIVFDNCSQDNSVELIRNHFPWVRLIEGDSNLGFAEGNNRAASQAEGEILAFVNPDAFVSEDWLEPVVALLQERSDVGCVTPAIYIADQENVLNACGNRVHFSGITYCYLYGRPNPHKTPFEVEAISGAAFAIRKKDFERVGGFENTFFMYYEDTDLSLRVRRLGLKCVVAPQSAVYHAFKDSFHPQKIYYLERNRYLSLFSVLELRLLLLMLPSLLVIEGITWGYCILKGWGAVRSKATSWKSVFEKAGWIHDRRKSILSNPSDMSNLLDGFNDQLELAYVGGKVLPWVAETIAHLSAKPFLALARRIYRA